MSAGYTWRGKDVSRAMLEASRKAVDALQIAFQREIGKQLSKGGSTRALGNVPSTPGAPPHLQTGRLLRSWQTNAIVRKSGGANKTTISIGSNLVYAAIHEYGGVISAKGGGLAIPISKEAKRHSAAGGRARDFGRALTLIPRNGRPPLLIERTTKKIRGGDMRHLDKLHYILLKSVRLPARPYVRPAVEQLKPQAASIARTAFEHALRRFA